MEGLRQTVTRVRQRLNTSNRHHMTTAIQKHTVDRLPELPRILAFAANAAQCLAEPIAKHCAVGYSRQNKWFPHRNRGISAVIGVQEVVGSNPAGPTLNNPVG